eukprot:3889107-Alexandrium_andersonii.AAC.1
MSLDQNARGHSDRSARGHLGTAPLGAPIGVLPLVGEQRVGELAPPPPSLPQAEDAAAAAPSPIAPPSNQDQSVSSISCERDLEDVWLAD